MIKAEDTGFLKGYSREQTFRNLSLKFLDIETEKEIKRISINTRIEINENFSTQENKWFFNVHYSINWSKTLYFDINRETKEYQDYRTSQLFNYIDCNVFFDKVNKAKIKNKIKTILNQVIKHDQVVYADNQTEEKPKEADYTKYSETIEAELENVYYNTVLKKDKVLNTTL